MADRVWSVHYECVRGYVLLPGCTLLKNEAITWATLFAARLGIANATDNICLGVPADAGGYELFPLRYLLEQVS